MEPSEDVIMQVMMICGFDGSQDRALIVNALKKNNSNADAVVSEFYDNPQFRSKYGDAWQEEAFHGDRDGDFDMNGSSYHVESTTQNAMVDGLDPQNNPRTGGLQSRPPTRANSRSPLSNLTSNAVADWTGGLNGQSQEEKELQQALQLSMQDGQTSGVMDASTPNPHFGPATRENYESNSWSMTTTGGQTMDWNHNGPPTKRKREAGSPAFLLQGHTMPGIHQLGGLLTILHRIPLARNALLSLKTGSENYGQASGWWNGQEDILSAHIQAKINTKELRLGSEEAKVDLEDEIHRLMAFLDSTERAYGIVSTLADLVTDDSRGAEKNFYEKVSVRNEDRLQSIFQTASLTDIASDASVEEETASFGLLEMEHNRDQYAHIKTLYESLDHVLWNEALTWNTMEPTTKMAMLKSVGEVAVFKFSGDGPGDSVEIPREFYPEKYLVSRKSEAGRIQAGWVEAKRQAIAVKQEQQRLTEWRDNSTSKVFQNKNIVSDAKAQWETYEAYMQGKGRFRAMEKSGFNVDKYPDYHAAPIENSFEEKGHLDVIEDAIKGCQSLDGDLEGKLAKLQEKAEQIGAKQRFLGRLLTKPDKDRHKPFQAKKYLLRGVSSGMDICYVCIRAEPDLIDFDETPGPADQWWRCSFANMETKVEKVEIERMLQDVWQETKNPLMVYATEDAISTPRDPLSAPLERFVKADNKAFQQELATEQAAEPTDDAIPEGLNLGAMLGTSKRKLSEGSMDSMNSNRPSVGSLDSIDMEDRDALISGQLDGTNDIGFEGIGGDHFTATQQPSPPTTNDAGVPTPPNNVRPVDGQVHILDPEARETRSPEMQERGRLPSLIPVKSQEDGNVTTSAPSMDVDRGRN